jgi:L-seryl-tRNA(Ser) seleniumtransferase
MNESPKTIENRRLPQVDKVLRHPRMVARQAEIRRSVLLHITRRILSEERNASGDAESDAITSASDHDAADNLDVLVTRIENELDSLLAGNLRRIVNGTGIILSTNLGRAPLPPSVAEAASRLLTGYCNLELEMESGKRGERTSVVERQLAILTGCESALIVNNNAAAVMLAVSALAKGMEVIVSRGELIEIGGSFRLPDVIESAGGILKEVGTTNRTRCSDYEKAMGTQTGLVMKCHRSNFEITGFTEEAPAADLVALCRQKNCVFVEDLGSGALIDLAEFNLKQEPTVSDVIGQGVDLVMFSGDKLMGGSQAGVICGRASLIKKLRANPMYRALRADKLTIALIEQVLSEYMKVGSEKHLSVLRIATEPLESVHKRALDFSARLNHEVEWKMTLVPSRSTFGGGTLPGSEIESVAVSINPSQFKLSPDKFTALLRRAPTPVIGIIQSGSVLVDFRTVLIEDESVLFDSLKWVSQQPQIKRI